MDLTLLVLAAGIGSRFGGAKQLAPVGPGGETLLDYALYDALRAGFSKVVLVIRNEVERELREHVERVFGDAANASFAHQSLEQVPKGFSVPAARLKPWGTGHAVLAARDLIAEPFVVANADDFYGADAYARLADHLQNLGSPNSTEFAAAGYTLSETLSPHGGVSRAVCELDADGYLRRVTEVKEIQRRNGELAGVTVAGARFPLSGDETVSMNLWAATPAALPMLEEQFVEFLGEHIDDLKAEFLLSEAVNEQIAEGRARVKVLPTFGPWLGVTYKHDRAYVAQRIAELVEAGEYPADLKSASFG